MMTSRYAPIFEITIRENVSLNEWLTEWKCISSEAREYNYFSLLNIAIEEADCVSMPRSETLNYVDIYYLTNQCNRRKQALFNVIKNSLVCTLWIGEECEYGDFKFSNHLQLMLDSFLNNYYIFSGLDIYLLIAYCCTSSIAGLSDDLLQYTFNVKKANFLRAMGYKGDVRKRDRVRKFLYQNIDPNFMGSFLVTIPERFFRTKVVLSLNIYSNCQTFGFRKQLNLLRLQGCPLLEKIDSLREARGKDDCSGHLLGMFLLSFLLQKEWSVFYDIKRWLLLLHGNSIKYGGASYHDLVKKRKVIYEIYEGTNDEPESRREPTLWHSQLEVYNSVLLLREIRCDEKSLQAIPVASLARLDRLLMEIESYLRGRSGVME